MFNGQASSCDRIQQRTESASTKIGASEDQSTNANMRLCCRTFGWLPHLALVASSVASVQMIMMCGLCVPIELECLGKLNRSLISQGIRAQVQRMKRMMKWSMDIEPIHE